MPSKKKDEFMFSVTPELYKRSHMPTSTIAMGMKFSQASSQNWVNQVAREQAIRSRWQQTYDPAGSQVAQQADALQRTLGRGEKRRTAYLGKDANPELHTILYGGGKPSAASAAATTAAPTGEAGIPNPRARIGWQDASAGIDRVSATRTYLKARCDRYTVPQRYPAGPATAAQAIGWTAAVALSGSGGESSAASTGSPTSSGKGVGGAPAVDLYRPVRHRHAIMAYRKPEDDDHALLFGYDTHPM